MKALSLMAITAGLAWGWSAPAQNVPKGADPLRGRWAVVGAIGTDGKVTPLKQDDPRYFTFDFTAGKVTTRLKKLTIEGKYKLTPAKGISHIDIIRRRGKDAVTFQGIYALDGDRLKVCLAGAGHPRPKAFKAGKGVEFAVELKRVKE